MKLAKIAPIIIAINFLPSCSSSSGVVPIGNNTYMISRSHKSASGSAANVKAQALKEANAYCVSRGKIMKLIKTSQSDMRPFKADAAAEIYFMALDPNDPELKRPVKVEEIRQ